MFCPGRQKWHGMFCPGWQKLHGMFCPGWQIDAGCFVRGGKKWHGMFCPGMFCPTFACLLTTPNKWYTLVTGLLLSIIFELPHGKASNLAYTFSGDPDQPGLPPGLISLHFSIYSKTCLKQTLKNRQNKDLNHKWSQNAPLETYVVGTQKNHLNETKYELVSICCAVLFCKAEKLYWVDLKGKLLFWPKLWFLQ